MSDIARKATRANQHRTKVHDRAAKGRGSSERIGDCVRTDTVPQLKIVQGHNADAAHLHVIRDFAGVECRPSLLSHDGKRAIDHEGGRKRVYRRSELDARDVGVLHCCHQGACRVNRFQMGASVAAAEFAVPHCGRRGRGQRRRQGRRRRQRWQRGCCRWWWRRGGQGRGGRCGREQRRASTNEAKWRIVT